MKLRPTSRWHAGYGPYLVADADRNTIVAWSFPAPEEVLDWLRGGLKENEAA